MGKKVGLFLRKGLRSFEKCFVMGICLVVGGKLRKRWKVLVDVNTPFRLSST